MVVAALVCFFMAFRYEKIESDEAQEELRKKAISIDKIFVNDALEEQRRMSIVDAARRSSVKDNNYGIN